MAQYNGYVSIPHSSYDEWRNATLGSGYNADYNPPHQSWGNQCWDYCAEYWYQYGLRLRTKPSGNGGAADCWLVSRAYNAKYPFIAVEGKENIKRGDVIVWNRSSSSSTGHIAFADEDYRGNRINTLGQVPSLHGQNGVVSVDEFSLNNFLGIFRNVLWQTDPPSPSTPKKKSDFPFIVAKYHWWNR